VHEEEEEDAEEYTEPEEDFKTGGL